MIKRIIACLTICLIITGVINPVFSDASALPQPNWSNPGISEIINISDLTGWMINGGTFDVSQYTDAESFMNDYFNARTKTRLVSPGEAAEDYYEVLPGFGINNQLVAGESFARPLDTNRVIASSFRDHTGYGRRLSNEVNDALLSTGSLYDTKIPLLNEVEFANFVNYNHDALRLYSEFFDNEQPSGPDIPSDIQILIDVINKREDSPNRFWLPFHKNLTNTYYSDLDIANYSWFTYNGDWQLNTFKETTNSTYNFVNTIQDIYINKISDNSYSCQFHWTGSIYSHYHSDLGRNYDRCSFVYNTSTNLIAFHSGTLYVRDITFNSSGTLQQIFNALKDKVKNVNIYVDNVPWSIAGDSSPSTPTITPEFPDAVGGEDLPTTTWPISRPRAPYYTNIPGVLQAIEDAIADDGKLDIDDLKPYLTDENGDPVPDPVFDPEPIPIPVPDPVNPDVVPGLPVLPAMPPEMPGFNGVSVLAEIINFTNQSLPTTLIVTFWGIIFGIVILGLIKILHK